MQDFIEWIKNKLSGKDIPKEILTLERKLTAALAEAKDGENGGVSYALSPNAERDVEKALSDKNYTEDVRLTEGSPAIIASQRGARNLPMLMKASHIRENIFTEAEARQHGLKVNENINYHGLGDKLFLKIIGGLDEVQYAYRGTKNADKSSRRENYFLLISQYKDAAGSTINIPVYINEHGQYNRVFIETNKIATVFGKSDMLAYLQREVRKGNLVRIKNKSTQASELTSPINASYSSNAPVNNKIPQSEPVVNSILRENSKKDTKNLSDVSDSGKQQYSFGDGRGRGYVGKSMSVNARDAYLNDEKPLSKWNKTDIIELVENYCEDNKINANMELIKKLTLPELRKVFLTNSSWHHTGAFYNATNFYEFSDTYLKHYDETDFEDIIKNRKRTTKNAEERSFEKTNKNSLDEAKNIFRKIEVIQNSGIVSTKRIETLVNEFIEGTIDIDKMFNQAINVFESKEANRIKAWERLPQDHWRHKSVESFYADKANYFLKNYSSHYLSSNSKIIQKIKNHLNDIALKNSGKQYAFSLDNSNDGDNKKYDYTKPFSQQVDDYKAGKFPQNDTLVVGATPQIWQDVGFNAIPVTINQTHVDYAINGSKDVDHFIGEKMLKDLPNAIKNPIAIIQSQSKGKNNRAVVIFKWRHINKNVIGAIKVDGQGTTNNINIDSNAFTTIFAKSNIVKQLKNAIDNTINGKAELFYWQKKKAISLLQQAGVQFSSPPPQNDGFIYSIRDPKSKVKTKFENVTETSQFKKWFGDWQKKPGKINPIFLDADGTPKVFYHGAKKNGGFSVFRPWQYFTENKNYAERYAERENDSSLYAVYLQANKVFDTRDADARRVFDSIRQEYGLGELQDTGLPDWTDGYDISDYLDEHPELGYDAIILDEGGDLVDGEPVSRGESIVIKDATQVKSATENIGTFDRTNPDIRYSFPLDNSNDVGYNNTTNREVNSYEPTDEFRRLQEESRRMSEEDIQLYHSGERKIDDELRKRFSRSVRRIFVGANDNGVGNANGILNLNAKGNRFDVYEDVGPQLFHDVFEIARKFLKYGELVDLHEVNTTEDGIGYKDCLNFLSKDGLSGFSITPDGDLISVFNASGKKGFLRAISDIVKEKSKTLDCYASSQQNLKDIYSSIFGFKTASVMEYNMEYDHDNIAENHGYPQVAFMVNTPENVETRYFTENQYDEAVAYRDSFLNGKQYVRASEQQVIKGGDPQLWKQQIAKYINKELRNWNDFDISTVEGDVLTLTRDTAYKAGSINQIRNQDGTYRTMTQDEYLTKLNAEVHINELAQVSKKIKKPNVHDSKNHRFAKNGFSYRTAYFQDYDGEYYKITLSVGENGNNSTVYNVGKLKKIHCRTV